MLNFSKKNTSNTSSAIRLVPGTVSDYRRLTSLLLDRKLSHHSFTFKQDRPKIVRVVIRSTPKGIPDSHL